MGRRFSGLIDDYVLFTLAVLIMAQDPTLLKILPPLLVVLALCILPWKGGASAAMSKAQRAQLLAAVPAATGGVLGSSRLMVPQLLQGFPSLAALPSVAVGGAPR